VCMMLYLALRRKSAEPPRPLSMGEPITQVPVVGKQGFGESRVW